MNKKMNETEYEVKREFLNRYDHKELVCRIIKIHIEIRDKYGNIVESC